ncbi:LOW QUALITY PROTEIN: hypothetical protein U9M48_001415, partial [Paspalum notatum var. saurae]
MRRQREPGFGEHDGANRAVPRTADEFKLTAGQGVGHGEKRNETIDGGAKGLILEQYSTDALEFLLYCEGYMPCVVVDKEMALRISSDTNIYI